MSDPLRFGTDPESIWEAQLEDIHKAEHLAARGVSLTGRPVCRECNAARVIHIREVNE